LLQERERILSQEHPRVSIFATDMIFHGMSVGM